MSPESPVLQVDSFTAEPLGKSSLTLSADNFHLSKNKARGVF